MSSLFLSFDCMDGDGGGENETRQSYFTKTCVVFCLHDAIFSLRSRHAVITRWQAAACSGEATNHNRHSVKQMTARFQNAPAFAQGRLRVENVLQRVGMNDDVDR